MPPLFRFSATYLAPAGLLLGAALLFQPAPAPADEPATTAARPTDRGRQVLPKTEELKQARARLAELLGAAVAKAGSEAEDPEAASRRIQQIGRQGTALMEALAVETDDRRRGRLLRLLSDPAVSDLKTLQKMLGEGPADPRTRDRDARGPAPEAIRSAGLFIGINDFEDDNVADLRFAVDDAIDLAYHFVYTLDLIEPQDATVLIAGQPVKAETKEKMAWLQQEAPGSVRQEATRNNILKAAYDLSDRTGPQGMLLLTCSTHGFEADRGGYLIAGDSRLQPPGILKATAIDAAFLLDLLSKGDGNKQLVLLDASRERVGNSARTRGLGPIGPMINPNAMPEFVQTPEFLQAFADASGMAIIQSAKDGSFAYEDDSVAQNGLFTHFFLQAFTERDDAGDDRIFQLGEILKSTDHHLQAATMSKRQPQTISTTRLNLEAVDIPLAMLPPAQKQADDEEASSAPPAKRPGPLLLDQLQPLHDIDGEIKPLEYIQSAGLFVGINDFNRDEIVDLRFAVDDAIDMAWLFVEELQLVPPEKANLFISGKPVKPESQERFNLLLNKYPGMVHHEARYGDILMALTELAPRTGPKGMIIASIHSHAFEDGENSYILAQDSSLNRALLGSLAVRGEVLAESLHTKEGQAGRTLVFLDVARQAVAQHEGAKTRSGGPDSERLASDFDFPGALVIHSAKDGSYAYEDPQIAQNGLFTHYLIQALGDPKAADELGFVRLAFALKLTDRLLQQATMQQRIIQKLGLTELKLKTAEIPIAFNREVLKPLEVEAVGQEKERRARPTTSATR